MQAKDAAELRKRFKGECLHPRIDKEYYLGAQTMDYVCTTCGKNFDKEDYQEIINQRRDKRVQS